jgi:RNA polymerase subunit RPABC4/transcription elongation factor Spt4
MGIIVTAFFVSGFNGCNIPIFTVPTSLHTTIEGMRTFYTALNGDEHFTGSDGYLHITGVDYDDLACKNCHDATKPDDALCNNCHTDLIKHRDEIPNQTCLGCHSRQGKEVSVGFTDVHSTEYPNCVDCHSSKEMHGDGMPYKSMWDEGARDTTCESCHTGKRPVGTAITADHEPHLGKLHCSACHVKSVVTCYNCHFDSEVNGTGKIAHATVGSDDPDQGWVFLVNHNNQVRAGNFQSLVYEGGNTFVAFAPFHSHSVTKDRARVCSDCHNNAAVQELEENGSIVVTSWNEETDKVVQNAKGAIPVVDGQLEFTFVDLDNIQNKVWSLIGNETENTQYGYCTPLTSSQVDKLKLNLGDLHGYIIENELMAPEDLERLKIE